MASLDPAEGVLRTRPLVSALSMEWGGGGEGRRPVPGGHCPNLMASMFGEHPPMHPTSSALNNWVR